jgi:hypothetical protein
MEDVCAYGVAKFIVLLTLFLLFGVWGCGMSGGSEDAHSVMGQDVEEIQELNLMQMM